MQMNVIKITLTAFVEIFIPEYPTFVSSTIFSNRILQNVFYFTRIQRQTNIRHYEHNINWPFLTHKTSFYTANSCSISTAFI